MFFSRTILAAENKHSITKGNTAVAAEFAQKITGGDMFEIRTVKDYPVNYKQCTDIAAEEGSANARPELRGSLPDISSYNTIIMLRFTVAADIHGGFADGTSLKS